MAAARSAPALISARTPLRPGIRGQTGQSGDSLSDHGNGRSRQSRRRAYETGFDLVDEGLKTRDLRTRETTERRAQAASSL